MGGKKVVGVWVVKNWSLRGVGKKVVAKGTLVNIIDRHRPRATSETATPAHRISNLNNQYKIKADHSSRHLDTQ